MVPGRPTRPINVEIKPRPSMLLDRVQTAIQELFRGPWKESNLKLYG